jgi:hypothetical protein
MRNRLVAPPVTGRKAWIIGAYRAVGGLLPHSRWGMGEDITILTR